MDELARDVERELRAAHLDAREARAELDALTGLRNHGAFQRELGQAIDESNGTPFAILLMDLDAFKAYNDTRGHPAGDTLLRQIATAIGTTIRDTDRAYRFLRRLLASHRVHLRASVGRAPVIFDPAFLVED